MKDDDIEPLVVRPRVAQRLLNLSNTKFYSILPELESFKEGRATMITMRSIKARVARKLAEASKSTSP
jgi:hypothetical protein